MNYIIIHGEKHNSDCSIHSAFKERLKKAILISKKQKNSIIIILGGKTRKNCISESKAGKNFLRYKIKKKIIVEQKSKTTIENIKFLKKILNHKKFHKLYVITSKKRIFRLKLLYQMFWPGIYLKIKFIPSKDSYPLFFYLKEIIYLLFNYIDSNEKGITFITKKLFRNYP